MAVNVQLPKQLRHKVILSNSSHGLGCAGIGCGLDKHFMLSSRAVPWPSQCIRSSNQRYKMLLLIRRTVLVVTNQVGVIFLCEMKKTIGLNTEKELAKLGRRIKQLRIERGYTNYENFAFDHDIPRAQFGRYERGEDLRYLSLLKITKAFGISLKEFFGEGFESSK